MQRFAQNEMVVVPLMISPTATAKEQEVHLANYFRAYPHEHWEDEPTVTFLLMPFHRARLVTFGTLTSEYQQRSRPMFYSPSKPVMSLQDYLVFHPSSAFC
jgi:hypothetical protein